jgi:hypothetical protein
MAKRRSSYALAPRTTVVRAPAPIIRVSAPRAPKRRRSHRRSSGGGGGNSRLMKGGLGGLAFGLLVKSGVVDKLPEIPVIGRTGTAALALNYFSKGQGMLGDAAFAAACIAGYQMGFEGHIHGLTTTGDTD